MLARTCMPTGYYYYFWNVMSSVWVGAPRCGMRGCRHPRSEPQRASQARPYARLSPPSRPFSLLRRLWDVRYLCMWPSMVSTAAFCTRVKPGTCAITPFLCECFRASQCAFATM
eukprot:scaffold217_cov377-Prasinococcus_capsulatus_cf.AAC.3